MASSLRLSDSDAANMIIVISMQSQPQAPAACQTVQAVVAETVTVCLGARLSAEHRPPESNSEHSDPARQCLKVKNLRCDRNTSIPCSNSLHLKCKTFKASDGPGLHCLVIRRAVGVGRRRPTDGQAAAGSPAGQRRPAG